jgi:mycothiol synthase
MADVPAVHELVLAGLAVDAPDWRPAQEDLEVEFSTETVDLATDSLVGLDADGHVLASALVITIPSRRTMVRVYLEGAVHPSVRGRGIGRRLLAWQLDRARQILVAAPEDLPGQIELGARPDTAPARLAARFGLDPVRYWIEMERPLGDPVLVGEPPAGYVLRALEADDIEALRVAKNDSFRDHWGSQPMLPDEWGKLLAPPRSRHDLSRIVLDPDGRIVAFTIVDVDPDSFAARGGSYGYIHWVGTIRDARGLGLSSIALGAVLRALQDDGLAAAVLDVDAENPSGALGLYERLGFVRATTSATYALTY